MPDLRQALSRWSLVLAVLMAILAAGAGLRGKLPLAGPCFSAAWVCLALSSPGIPALRRWSFTIWVSTAVVAGLVFPTWFIGAGDFKYTRLFKPILMVIMFSMGTTLSAGDFLGVLRMPAGVAVGFLGHFFIMPMLGYTLAKAFRFPPEIAAGVILVGVAPSGLASNVMCFIAKANVALSVTVTAVGSLLSPILTPLLMKLLAGQLIEIDTVGMMIDISKMVLIPILAGLAFHHWLLHRFKPIERILPHISMIGIIAMTVLTIAIGRDNLLRMGLTLLAACLLHNLGGYTLGYSLCRAFRMDRQTARTVAIEVGMQNCGLASGIAASLHKVATLGLAPIIFGPIMNTTASILANWWRARPAQAQPNNTAEVTNTHC